MLNITLIQDNLAKNPHLIGLLISSILLFLWVQGKLTYKRLRGFRLTDFNIHLKNSI